MKMSGNSCFYWKFQFQKDWFTKAMHACIFGCVNSFPFPAALDPLTLASANVEKNAFKAICGNRLDAVQITIQMDCSLFILVEHAVIMQSEKKIQGAHLNTKQKHSWNMLQLSQSIEQKGYADYANDLWRMEKP